MAATVSDPKHDRRITVVIVLTAIVVVLIGLGTPAVISTSNTTRKVVEGNDLTGCRSSFNAEVTNRRTEFDIARSHRDTTAAKRDNAQIAVSVAAIFRQGENLEQLLTDLERLGHEVDAANMAVADAEAALTTANADYQDAVALSIADPDGFLADCTGGD